MEAEVDVVPGYPVTVNDDDVRERSRSRVAARSARRDELVLDMPTPVMGAEDFSYVLQQRPGAMAFLGVCPPGEHPKRAHACHSNRMMIDEDGDADRHRDARGGRALEYLAGGVRAESGAE